VGSEEGREQERQGDSKSNVHGKTFYKKFDKKLC
jgi:hypothetical protein